MQTSSAFNRGGDPFPGLSPDGTDKVIGFAFAGEGGRRDRHARPHARTAWVVVDLKQHKIATREEFEKDRADLRGRICCAEKRDEALSLYVKRLRDRAKDDIKIDEAYMQEASVDGGASGEPEDEDQY